jgi:hypothetical protein
VDPETLAPVPGEAEGLLRVDDLANLDNVYAVQTSDLAHRASDGFQLLGRAPRAAARTRWPWRKLTSSAPSARSR